MDIIFVGIHNKPNKLPLCSSTMTGKVIDEIIKRLGNDFSCTKTNLFDLDQLPDSDKQFDLADKFIRNRNHNCLYVLLGKKVKSHLHDWIKNSIAINHPSYLNWKSKDERILYISDAVELIKKY